jgi:hypothetical protein
MIMSIYKLNLPTLLISTRNPDPGSGVYCTGRGRKGRKRVEIDERREGEKSARGVNTWSKRGEEPDADSP